jgi:hypothetical protein
MFSARAKTCTGAFCLLAAVLAALSHLATAEEPFCAPVEAYNTSAAR